MDIILDLLAGLIIICLLGAMLFATKALKAKNDKLAQKQHLTKAGLFFVAYGLLNLLRMLMENQLL